MDMFYYIQIILIKQQENTHPFANLSGVVDSNFKKVAYFDIGETQKLFVVLIKFKVYSKI